MTINIVRTELDKRITVIDRMINYYSNLREIEKNKTDKKGHELVISLLVNQKIKIQEFYSKTN